MIAMVVGAAIAVLAIGYVLYPLYVGMKASARGEELKTGSGNRL